MSEEEGVPRHYGRPADEYEEATRRAALVDRSHRYRFRVEGRAPSQMLSGILTGRIPSSPTPVVGDAARGLSAYSAALTPKGRMVTDLTVYALSAEGERLLLDVPAAGGPGLIAHLRRFLPPRMATLSDMSAESGGLLLIGPDGAKRAAESLRGHSASAAEGLEALEAREYLTVQRDDGGWFTVGRNDDLIPDVLELLGDASFVRTMWKDLTTAGVAPTGLGVYEILRVEAGTPAFGADMSEDTLPPEAGIEDRAFDHTKGCYTGQEVIVRIRDRGHVNRHLRGLRFGEGPTPRVGTELFLPDGDRAVGVVTSAALSPRAGQVIGLGMVRREVGPPATVRLGAPEGAPVAVHSLDGWR